MMWRSSFWSISSSRRAGLLPTTIPRKRDRLYDYAISQLIECGAEVPEIEEGQSFGTEGPYLLPMLYRGSIGLEDGKK